MTDATATAASFPHNPTTGRAYRGNNIAALLIAGEAAGYPTAAWAGYGQWAAAGRQVCKGQKSTTIAYMVEYTTKKGEKKLRPRTLRVFNIAQTQEMTEEERAEYAAKKAKKAKKSA